MTSEIKVTPPKEEMPDKEGPGTPLLDLSDAAIKELIRSAARLRHSRADQRFAIIGRGQVRADRGHPGEVNVVETWGAEPGDAAAVREEPEDETESELVEAQQRPVPVKSGAKEPSERTDDPVRMYSAK